MKQPVTMPAFIVFCLVLSSSVGAGCHNTAAVKVIPPATPEEKAAVLKIATQVEAGGSTTAADYLKADALADKATRTKSLSSEDVAWLVAYYHQKPIRADGALAKSTAPSHHVTALLAFRYAADNLTDAQKEAVAQLCLPLLASKDPNPRNARAEKISAINTLSRLKYRQALPQIQPLVSDPDKWIHEAAQNAVDALSLPFNLPLQKRQPAR